MGNRHRDYRAYLLRLWRVRDNGHCWRASLEDAGTRQRHAFADMADLVDYLTTITDTGLIESESGYADEHDDPEDRPG